MGNIECVLATVNNLSDSDLKILANLIMDRLNPEKAFASPVKIVPRMECPVCHTSAHVVSFLNILHRQTVSADRAFSDSSKNLPVLPCSPQMGVSFCRSRSLASQPGGFDKPMGEKMYFLSKRGAPDCRMPAVPFPDPPASRAPVPVPVPIPPFSILPERAYPSAAGLLVSSRLPLVISLTPRQAVGVVATQPHRRNVRTAAPSQS